MLSRAYSAISRVVRFRRRVIVDLHPLFFESDLLPKALYFCVRSDAPRARAFLIFLGRRKLLCGERIFAFCSVSVHSSSVAEPPRKTIKPAINMMSTDHLAWPWWT
jgi:hypothetical protein